MTDSMTPNLVTPDVGGAHAGDLLRRAREAQGLTLDQLASQIKVSPQKLEALEQGLYERLGDSNFTRALAMTVCRTLRIDASEILAGLPAARLHALSQEKPAINAPFRDHRSVPALFERGHRLNLRALLAPKWSAPLALLAAAAVIYALPDTIEWPTWPGRASESTAETSLASTEGEASSQPSSIQVAADLPVVPAAQEPASVASAIQASDAVMAPASTPVAPNSAAASVADTPTPVVNPLFASTSLPSAGAAATASPLRILLTDNSWLEVVDGSGAKLFSRIAKAGEALELQGQPPLKIRIGNASAVQVSYKGQPVSLTDITRNNTARVELK